MSTILRGYTSIQNKPKIVSSELCIELKTAKDGRALFIIDITDKAFRDFDGQVKETIEYLRRNKSALSKLKHSIGELSWDIDFGYKSRIATGELAIEGLHFPMELIKSCSELEIELLISVYDSRLFEE